MNKAAGVVLYCFSVISFIIFSVQQEPSQAIIWLLMAIFLVLSALYWHGMEEK